MPIRAAFLAILLPLLGSDAQAAERVAWLTGAELDRQLEVSVGAAWARTPLREGLGRFAEMQRLAIVIDRRVDPGRPLVMAVPERPLRETCDAIAAELGLGFSRVGPIGYLGPKSITDPLRTLVAIKTAEVQQAPAAIRTRLTKTQPLHWDDLATPRELVEQLAREVGLTVQGVEQVPHDLWAGVDLPPLTWVERLSLVVAQLDLTFRIDSTGRTLTLVPIPDDVVVERRYAIVDRPQDTVERWKRLAPGAKIELADGRITVVGRIEDHERLMPAHKPPVAPPQPGMKPVVGPGQQVHSLKVDNIPLGKLIDALGNRLSLTIRFDRAAAEQAGIKLDQLVSVKVQNASTDELFREFLTPAGLTYKRTGATVEIFVNGKGN